MATEGASDRSIASRQRRRGRLAIVVVAIVCLVGFGYAWANVTMRLQRHITARVQCRSDRGKLGMVYGSLATAAAGNDAMAYGLLLQIALNDVNSLQSDSSAMPAKEAMQTVDFVSQAQRCLPNTIAAFNAQPPQTTADCRQLLLSK